MKKSLKKMLLVLVIIFILIQFIRPPKNVSDKPDINGIATKYNVPDSVQKILKASCYDCHSNHTIYPWYAEVQPVAWWLNNHIEDGKRGLNFSEFTTYPIRKQYRKLEEINDLVKKDDMPLKSYLIIHTYAKLSDQQKQLIAGWVTNLRNSIKTLYPPDSLIRKKQAKENSVK